MVGLHVQLDVEYASDDKLIEAGPMAELLYVRGLCFAKRTLTDGRITHGQLAAVALGIPSPTRHARRLVEVGAWRATATGYQIVSWLKRNKAAATVRAEAERKSKEGIAKNHKRWHIDEGKTSPTCPLCYPETDPAVDPPPDPLPESSEEEEEEEAQPEEEAEETFLATAPPAPKESIRRGLDTVLGEAGTPSERSNRQKTINELAAVGATIDAITTRCAIYRIRWPGMELTDAALRKHWSSLASSEPPTTPSPQEPPPQHPPSCHCEGHGNGTAMNELERVTADGLRWGRCPGPDEPHPSNSYLDSLPTATVTPIHRGRTPA